MTTTKTVIALAPISSTGGIAFASGIARAYSDHANKVAKAEASRLETLVALSRGLGVGSLTATQFDKQLRRSVREALEAKASAKNATLNRASVPTYVSNAKTFCLAIVNKVGEPLAGETLEAFLKRMVEPVALAKLADGSPVYDQAKQGRKAGAKGAKLPKGASGVGSAGTEAHVEGGMNIRPKLAAALILADQNPARAERLCIALENYTEEFDRWVSSILTDTDKAELKDRVASTVAALQPEPAKASTVTGNTSDSLPAVGAALVAAQAKANAKGRRRAA